MTKEEKIEIKRLRGLGYTQSEVALQTGFSIRSIKRVDAEKRAKVVDFPEPEEAEIFSDSEEGWESTYSKELGARTPDSKSWNFIVYEDSAPEDWKEQLIAWGCPLLISPVHNRDTWKRDDLQGRYKAGDLKKSHWHGNVKLGKKCSLKKASMMIQRVTHGPVPQPCDDEPGLIMYMAHRHRDGSAIDGKFQYNPEKIEYYNGWEAEASEMDKRRMRIELEKFLTGLTDNYAVAVNAVRVELGAEYSALMRQDSHHYRGIIEGNRYLSDGQSRALERMLEREQREQEEAENWWTHNNTSIEKGDVTV